MKYDCTSQRTLQEDPGKRKEPIALIVNKTIARGAGASGSFIIRFPLRLFLSLPDGQVQRRLSLSVFAVLPTEEKRKKKKLKGRRECSSSFPCFSLDIFFSTTLLGLESQRDPDDRVMDDTSPGNRQRTTHFFPLFLCFAFSPPLHLFFLLRQMFTESN